MQIDRNEALGILEHEVELAKTDAGPSVWRRRIESLEEACGDSNLTFFAALGTAMLAKATDTDVDVFSLKAGSSDRGYSARSLCQHVLAAYAPRLGIDLGVTGREPLNNSPFFRESTISDQLVVKPGQSPALATLLNCLRELDKIKTRRAAKGALRAFLSVRQRADTNWTLNTDAANRVALRSYAKRVSAYVARRSENGRRAQAVAAGILDAAFGCDRVETGRINDPDARFVGDVVVYSDDDKKQVQHSFEVRDKRVNDADLNHFTVRLTEHGVSSGAMICPINDVIDESLVSAIEWAEDRNIILRLYPDWNEFVTEVFFWSSNEPSGLLSLATTSIFSRLRELEVSNDGIQEWVDSFTDD